MDNVDRCLLLEEALDHCTVIARCLRLLDDEQLANDGMLIEDIAGSLREALADAQSTLREEISGGPTPDPAELPAYLAGAASRAWAEAREHLAGLYGADPTAAADLAYLWRTQLAAGADT